mmetsp:Transcript_21052/g.57999  ORF Transcript_21052/g.57999 Transcript_21052/m.57999 type:complete len:107 (+) Transcript_21052:46-366(+)
MSNQYDIPPPAPGISKTQHKDEVQEVVQNTFKFLSASLQTMFATDCIDDISEWEAGCQFDRKFPVAVLRKFWHHISDLRPWSRILQIKCQPQFSNKCLEIPATFYI